MFFKRPPSPPTKEQQRKEMLTRMGVENPQTRNMERNVLHTQIENFDRSKLKPKTDEQRYMISPHEDVRNFMANSRGMGEQALRDNHPMVRPVFKDIQQRENFHKLADTNLTKMGSFNSLTKPEDKRNFQTYEKLKEWSHPDNAMMNFSGVDTKRSHPIVFVQGHGSPGDEHIYSDAHEKTSAKDVAKLVDKLGVPKVSQVRVNSCFSGTQHDLSTTPDVRKKFQQQTIEQSAGQWSKTMAGSLDQHLNQSSYKSRYDAHKSEVDSMMKRPLGTWGKMKAFFNSDNLTDSRKKAIDKVSERHNRVVGYMGPTTQGSTTVTTRDSLGKLGTQTHTGVVFGPDNNPSYYKHGDVTRTGPVRDKKR